MEKHHYPVPVGFSSWISWIHCVLDLLVLFWCWNTPWLLGTFGLRLPSKCRRGVRHGAGTMVQASAGQWRRGVWEETPSTFPGAGGTRAEPRRVDATGALLRSRGWGMMWGFPKSWGYPWIIHWNGSFRYNPPFWDTPIMETPMCWKKKYRLDVVNDSGIWQPKIFDGDPSLWSEKPSSSMQYFFNKSFFHPTSPGNQVLLQNLHTFTVYHPKVCGEPSECSQHVKL